MLKWFRGFKDVGIHGATARWYDKNSRQHRLDEMRGYAQEVARHISEGSTVLEVAPGPGYLSIELAKLGSYQIVGLDISEDFVEIAQRNAQEAGVDIDFRQGNVSEIPFDEQQVDFIICTAAFKNFHQPHRAIKEMYRVLKPGGTALIIDMNGSASKQQIKKLTSDMGVRGFEALFMNITFKFLKKGAYTPEGMSKLLAETKIPSFEVREEGVSLYTYLKKLVE